MPALDQLIAPPASESERVIVEAELVSKDGSLWGRVEGSSALWGPVEGTGAAGDRVVLALAQDGTPFVVWPGSGGGEPGPPGPPGDEGVIAVYEQASDPDVTEEPDPEVGSLWLDTDEPTPGIDPIAIIGSYEGEYAPTMRDGGNPTTFSASIASTGCRFAPQRSFTCRSIALCRIGGDYTAHTWNWGVYDAAGNLIWNQTKANLFTRGHGGSEVVALTLATPFDFEAGEVYYVAFRSTLTISVYGVDMSNFAPGMMFQETLPNPALPHGLAEGIELGRTEYLATTGNPVGSPAPQLTPTIAGWAGGVNVVQAVASHPLIALREDVGNVAA